jgi:hypothetical protein
MGPFGQWVVRVLRRRVVSSALLFLVTFFLTDTVGHFRRPGEYLSLGLLVGLAFLVLSLLIFLQRLLTMTPSENLRPALEEAERYAALVALNLILLNLLAPVAGLLSLLPASPLIHGVLIAISRLSGRLLFALFVVGVGLLAILMVVRILDRVVLRTPPARRVARGIHRLAVGAIALYALYAIALAYNGGLDTAPAAEHRTEVVRMWGWPPFLQWADLRGWEPGHPITRIWVFTDRDGPEMAHLTPGQPVMVRVRPGFLGIAWVDTMRPDPSPQASAILRVAPTAGLVRRELIRSRLREGRWAEALEETETHHRQYPRDSASLAEIAQILRAADRPREASTVEELGRVASPAAPGAGSGSDPRRVGL